MSNFDAEDDNVAPPCDSNVWLGNRIGTHNQACVLQHP